MFERIFVINLVQHTERLKAFQERLPKSLQGLVEVWPGIDGTKVKPPSNWRCSTGMWGLQWAHIQILQFCIQNNIESYFVMEDDCVFADDFDSVLSTLVDKIPDDWQAFYPGGQLLECLTRLPKRYNEWFYIPYDVNRTHSMVVHRRGYCQMHQCLMDIPSDSQLSFDSHLGQLHHDGRFKVYVPHRWMCGQLGGKSLTSDFVMAPYEFWCDPAKVDAAYQMQFEPETLIELPPGAVIRDS